MEALARALKTLSDPLRLRLLHVLSLEELSVSDLTSILNAGQSRVSTHLARLLEDGWVSDRRDGRFVRYALSLGANRSAELRGLLPAVLKIAEEAPPSRRDLERLEKWRRQRPPAAGEGWGERDLPGRSWEAFARAALALMAPVRLADLGTGSGSMTALLAEHAEFVVAVDRDPAALERARDQASRAGVLGKMALRLGDICDPPIEAGEVDTWVLSQVLHLQPNPEDALRAAATLLAPGGRVLILDLAAHSETWVTDRYGHVHLGFSEERLRGLLTHAGFREVRVSEVGRDRRSPHFISLLATGRVSRS